MTPETPMVPPVVVPPVRWFRAVVVPSPACVENLPPVPAVSPESGALPQTGWAGTNLTILLGLAMMAAGGLAIGVTRRSAKKLNLKSLLELSPHRPPDSSGGRCAVFAHKAARPLTDESSPAYRAELR